MHVRHQAPTLNNLVDRSLAGLLVPPTLGNCPPATSEGESDLLDLLRAMGSPTFQNNCLSVVDILN